MIVNDWFVYPPVNSNVRLRLFCFPYAGGGSSIFRSWVETRSSNLEIFPIQLPGRENRFTEPPFTQLSALVKILSEILLPCLDVPFTFFGHSMGALVSFELARQLRQQGYPTPVHLFVSGYPAPHLPNSISPLSQLPEAEFLAELTQLDGIPPEILQNTELMRLALPVIRSDFALVDSYHYTSEPPLDCAITAFGGLQDYKVSRIALEAWQIHTSAEFTVQMFAGNHFFLTDAKPMLLQIITQKLAQFL